jgi:hypothetical protein
MSLRDGALPSKQPPVSRGESPRKLGIASDCRPRNDMKRIESKRAIVEARKSIEQFCRS